MTLNDSSRSDLPAQDDRHTHRVFLIDSHTILREAVRLMVDANDEFDVVGEAGTVAEALHRIDLLEPDVVLTDIPMPDRSGVQLISELRARRPQLAILVLTTLRTPDRVAAAIKAGALGYILKDCGRAELLAALGEVAAGRKYLCKGLEMPGRRSATREPFASASTAATSLTERQRQVLRSVALGCGNKEIAQMLGIGTKAVQKHRDRLRNLLNVQTTAGLTMYAVREGLVSDLRTVDTPSMLVGIPAGRVPVAI
jgi:two-component system nitrate/nitrite response regulator NarL